MSREIKFRAWHKADKQMLFEGWNNDVFIQKGRLFDYGDSVEIMQFTGIRANDGGHEIYVGDVIEVIGETKTGAFKKFTGVVVDKGCDGYVIENKKDFFEFGLSRYDYKVIGNIYEHAHLLSKEQGVQVSDTTKAS
jgi:hypothetical protein